MIGARCKGDTWDDKFAQDARNEEGLCVVDRLIREDERRRFLQLKLIGRKPDSAHDRRTKPMLAMCGIEYRRRALIAKLSPGDRATYGSQLDRLGEALTWDEFRIGSAPKSTRLAESVEKERESAKMFNELMKARESMGVFNSWCEKYHSEAEDDARSGVCRMGLATREDWRVKQLNSRLRKVETDAGSPWLH